MSRHDAPTHRVSIAPMMKRTDRHYRYFMRLLTRRTLLYTEMVTTGAIIHGERNKLLGFSEEEKSISLQLGGDDPDDLARCAKVAVDWGYDEVNLNVGCPSDRVQNGNFGACLMKDPDRVARGVEAMRRAVDIPVTVKHRIGVDELDRYEDMENFVRTVASAGCERFTVHARKAWLEGLNPKQNREIPPLRYEDVYRLKQVFPNLFIEINGGIKSLAEMHQHLEHVDAVMLGRAAYDDPFLFSTVDEAFFGDNAREPLSRHEVVRQMFPYIEAWLAEGGKLNQVTRHMLQLFAGRPRGRVWRRILTTRAIEPGAGVEVVQEALESVPELDALRPATPPAAVHRSANHHLEASIGDLTGS